jgi:hypothetical protein
MRGMVDDIAFDIVERFRIYPKRVIAGGQEFNANINILSKLTKFIEH